MSVPVGAFASKSRPITAVNWSSDSSTEKSSSPRKLAGNTRRPCRLTTNGFTLLPPGRARSPACCFVLSCGGDPVHDLGHTCCRTLNAPVMFLTGPDWQGFSARTRLGPVAHNKPAAGKGGWMAEFTFAPLTPASFLDRSAAVFADRIAVVDGGRTVTYREVSDRCRRLTGA